METNKEHKTWLFVIIALSVILTLALMLACQRIEIDKSEGVLRAYQGIFKIMEFPVILGSSNSPTCIGQFEVLNKLENVNGIFNATFPKWLGIYRVNGYENGIHSVLNNTLWTEYSAGSVIVDPQIMDKLFKWVQVGTAVIIKL